MAVLKITDTVTLDGVSIATGSKEITVAGTRVDTRRVAVAAASVKTLFDLADASWSDQLSEFEFARIEAVDGSTDAGSLLVEVGGAAAGDDYIAIELGKGGWLNLFSDGMLTGRTGNGLAVYADLGSLTAIKSIRAINRHASTAAVFSMAVVD